MGMGRRFPVCLFFVRLFAFLRAALRLIVCLCAYLGGHFVCTQKRIKLARVTSCLRYLHSRVENVWSLVFVRTLAGILCAGAKMGQLLCAPSLVWFAFVSTQIRKQARATCLFALVAASVSARAYALAG